MAAMPKEPSPAFHTVSCLCGAEIRVDPLSRMRRVTCPDCKSPLDFVVSMDQKLKKPRVSIVIPLGLMKTEGPSLGASAPKPKPAPPPPATRTALRPSGRTVRGVIARCICGGSFPVNDEELTSVQSCPQCKVAYHVVVKRDVDKKRSAILVPVKPVGHHAGQIKSLIAPKPLPSSTRTRNRTQSVPAGAAKEPPPPARAQTVAKKGRTQVPRVPPPPAPPGTVAVSCLCGQPLFVRRKDLERGLTCEGCDRRLRFQESRDPQSLAPILLVQEDR